MTAPDAEVLGQVDYLYVGRYGMLGQEGRALAVPEAEEHDVHTLERHLVGESQLRIADESFVYVAHQIARIRLAVGKDNLNLGMAE